MTPEEKIKQLKAEIKALEVQIKERDNQAVFTPKEGEEFWYISTVNDICSSNWGGCLLDCLSLNVANIYRAEEHARTVLYNRRIHRFLQEQANFTPDWSDGKQEKWELFLAHDFSLLVGTSKTYYAQSPSRVCFKTNECARAAVKLALEKFGNNAFEKYFTVGVI